MAMRSTLSLMERILPDRSDPSFEVMLTEITDRERPQARPSASLLGTETISESRTGDHGRGFGIP